MEIKINGSPEEIAKLLQVVGSNLEQRLVKIIHNPSSIDEMTFEVTAKEVLSKNDPSKFPRTNLTI
ncbi:hypothetical protein [Candidatus Enterococcus leclercqii]|uniref:hypothetical protein n=1 Tax=Candidatus Enterococcus leclercqii TaxID=1857218 RepID=UPI00137B89DA|nr:hypothetical protein [Enterococcus sp. CU9D]KAF1291059.1 hypothetical protein BAU14_10730 [Enterococcus sp. CU9D]